MFWDRMAGIYDLYQVVERKVNDETAAICASYLHEDDTVLECACGTGIMTRVLAPACGRLIATDYSRRMLRRCWEKVRGQANVTLRYADITAIRCRDSCFDAAVAANVIHLLDDPDRALDELRRVVKPGGLLLIPTYVAQENARATAVTTVFRAMGTQFPRQFSRESYRQFFAERGIAAEYRMVRGLVPCCVAVIRVEK